jgi:hypothetical protein
MKLLRCFSCDFKNMRRYKINSPHVVSEVFGDEEAAVINLKTGTYYSLNKTATKIWSLVEKGANIEDLITFVVGSYEIEDFTAKADFDQFIEKLVKENLIVPHEAVPTIGETDLVNNSTQRRVYEKPVLESYEDMQELLLLDPIHEVEETNWLNNSSR